MEKKTYYLNTILALLVAIGLAAAILITTFAPAVILPELSIPNMVLISLVALVMDHYLAPGAKRCYICIPLFSAAAFGILPWAAGFLTAYGIVLFGALGAVVFTTTTWLYSLLIDRLSSGPAYQAAPLVSAVGLYLAAQCLIGIL